MKHVDTNERLPKRGPTETLDIRRKLPNGKVVGVHRWGTGFQILEFDNMAHFCKCKAAVEAKPLQKFYCDSCCHEYHPAMPIERHICPKCGCQDVIEITLLKP